MGHEYTIKYMCHVEPYIDFMSHENPKKSVPWIESHSEIYKNAV